MAFLYFFVFCIILVVTIKKKQDVFSPGRFFILTYSLLLSILSLNLSSAQSQWGLSTNLLFWGSCSVFISSGAIIFLLKKATHPFSGSPFNGVKRWIEEDAKKIDWNWFYGIWALCAFIFSASYFFGVFYTGIIPAFAKNPESARITFLTSHIIVNRGWFFGPLSLILATEIVFWADLHKWMLVIVVAFSLLVLALYLTLVTRLDLFRYFLFAIVLFHYGKKRLSLKHFLFFVAIGLGFLLMISFSRIKHESANSFTTSMKIRMPKKYLWASTGYAYVANNFWNFDYAVQKYIDGGSFYPRSFGFELLRPLFFFSHLEGIFSSQYRFDSLYNESVVKVRGLNTIIFIWHFYKDFGLWGMFFLIFILGCGLGIFYQNTMEQPTLLRVSLWAIFIGMIFFSYMVPLWSFWFTYLNVGVLLLAHKKTEICKGPSNDVRSEFPSIA
ncbi:MAG: O-antigen polymerase [Chitinivibrionales bacterium]